MDSVIPKHWMDSFSDDPPKGGSRLSPSERVKMIEKLYMEILSRKPDTRDLNFYKYSSTSEEEIRKELIDCKEHKTLIENGREHKKLKNLLEDSQSKINSLKAEISDQEKSLEEMNKLLKEKNLHIQELRNKENSPFNSN